MKFNGSGGGTLKQTFTMFPIIKTAVNFSIIVLRTNFTYLLTVYGYAIIIIIKSFISGIMAHRKTKRDRNRQAFAKISHYSSL